MFRQVCRLETDEGVGPFEYINRNWREGNLILDFFYGFADVLPWVHLEETDMLAQMMGAPQETMIPTPDHPHHLDDVWNPPDMERDPHKWHVGCKDEAQLEWWFPKSSWEFFTKYGFKRAIYEVECDYIHFGTYQLMFCIDNITLIERKPLGS